MYILQQILQPNRFKKDNKSTISTHIVPASRLGRFIEFHYWNTTIPQVELSNSTGGTHEFHPWNFLELEVKRLQLTVPTEKNVGLIVSTKCMKNNQQMLPISEKCTAEYTFFRKCTAT